MHSVQTCQVGCGSIQSVFPLPNSPIAWRSTPDHYPSEFVWGQLSRAEGFPIHAPHVPLAVRYRLRSMRLTVVVINNVQGANGSAIGKTVTHKIQGPGLIGQPQPAASLVFCASSAPNHGKPVEFAYGSSDDPDFSSSRSSFGSPSMAGFLPVGAVPAQFRDHLFSWLGNGRYSDLGSPFDTLAVRLVRVHPLRVLPARAALPLLEFFFDNILERFMFQTQVRIHLFQSPIFFFQFLQPFQFTDGHAAVLAFPLSIGMILREGYLITNPSKTLELENVAVWYDRAVFHFLTEEQHRQTYHSLLQKVVMPGGFIIMATFALDGATKWYRARLEPRIRK